MPFSIVFSAQLVVTLKHLNDKITCSEFITNIFLFYNFSYISINVYLNFLGTLALFSFTFYVIIEKNLPVGLLNVQIVSTKQPININEWTTAGWRGPICFFFFIYNIMHILYYIYNKQIWWLQVLKIKV